MTYTRPSLPYANEALPNAKRYTDLANNDRPPTAEMFDGDIDYLIDTVNVQQGLIEGVAAGIIPGAENPANVGKVPILASPNVYSFAYIDTEQLSPQAVTTDKINLGAVRGPQIQDGSIPHPKLAPGSVGTTNYIAGSIPTVAIADNAVTSPKLPNDVIIERHYSPLSIPTAAYKNLSVGTAALNDLNVTTGKIADGAVTLQKLAAAVVGFLLPTGSIIPYTGDVSPSAEFLLLDGTAHSRVTYAALFAICGTKFGAGDGVNTFNIPDARGRFLAGSINNNTNGRITVATVDTINIGGVGGTEQVTLDVTQMPAHTHGYSRGNVLNSVLSGAGSNVSTLTDTVTTSTGGGLPHSNMPPTLLVNYLIKT